MKHIYRNVLYKNYFSSHAKDLFGEVNLQSFRRNFPVLKYYYGGFLPGNKNARIVDLGCGTGEFVFWLNESGYINSYGIDLNEELVKKGISEGVSNLEVDDIFSHLEKSEEEFDLIIMRDVLEHFEREEIIEIVELIKTALKKNGKLILQVPNGQSPFYGRIFFGDFTHTNAFTDLSLKQIFLAVGFSDIHIKEVTPVPKTIISTIRFLLWKFIRLQLKIIQLIISGNSSGYFSPNILAVITR
jgi:2-polyprenyl-3-methyl-5-hydroxy-6-metoxy-1,4-benzoquinol methylase